MVDTPGVSQRVPDLRAKAAAAYDLVIIAEDRLRGAKAQRYALKSIFRARVVELEHLYLYMPLYALSSPPL